MSRIKKLFDENYRERKIMALINRYEWLSHTQWGKEKTLLHNIRQDYYNLYERYPDLNHPKDLNEKLLWLSYYWRHPLKARCADKYRCRDYVTKDCGLPEELLVPLYGVWDSPEDIDFSSLPDSFVLKCNHGCGYNIIVHNKSIFNIEKAKKELKQWLSESYSGNSSEIHYKKIQKHVIMCESYIGEDGERIEIQFFCFNGEAKHILVRNDLGDQEGKGFAISYDMNWNRVKDRRNEDMSISISRPSNLEFLVYIANTLSKPFPHVRIDLYLTGEKVYLGEMTFTTCGNILYNYLDETLIKWGEELILPHKYKEN